MSYKFRDNIFLGAFTCILYESNKGVRDYDAYGDPYGFSKNIYSQFENEIDSNSDHAFYLQNKNKFRITITKQ